VHDNGIGFPSGARTGGHGIIGMRERAQLAGGSLKIASPRGRGTIVAVTLPLPTLRTARRAKAPATRRRTKASR
jgi:glucose-6-phosphate-specific signal transduction histidine kinase